MMTGGEWRIEYFVEDNGRVPVREFLASLDAKTYARFQWSIEQLRLRNTQAKYPLVRPLAGKIWELREESTTNIYRILYCFGAGRRILLLHGLAKKHRSYRAINSRLPNAGSYGMKHDRQKEVTRHD